VPDADGHLAGAFFAGRSGGSALPDDAVGYGGRVVGEGDLAAVGGDRNLGGGPAVRFAVEAGAFVDRFDARRRGGAGERGQQRDDDAAEQCDEGKVTYVCSQLNPAFRVVASAGARRPYPSISRDAVGHRSFRRYRRGNSGKVHRHVASLVEMARHDAKEPA
jgi:hypothetical protein